MENDPVAELVGHYPEIIATMDEIFGAHEFILALAHRYQRAYVEALAIWAPSNKPFQILHGTLASKLHDFPELVEKLGHRKGTDIFGQTQGATYWRRLS